MTALERPYWIEALFERRDGWDASVYPFNLPVVRSLDRLAFHPNVTFLVGENGSGKSTLIEALAVAWGFNPEGGGREHRFGTRDSHSPLHRFVRPVRSAQRVQDGFFLRAESFFTVASYLESPEVMGSRYGARRLHEQSHGESFFALSTIVLSATAFTYWTNPRPPCHPAGSCPSSRACTSWSWRGPS